MSDVKITREVYKQYANKIATVLDNEEFFEQFKKRVDSGASSFKLGKKRLIQDISIDWIDTIEEILPNLDTIVRNPRRFIVQEEDIVDVSLARSISTESVKFLAQHTNMISKVEDDGSVIPSKILNVTKEESFEIYENRFIYTLLLKLKDFVTMRYDKIKKASATQDVLELDVESRFNLPSKKITFRTEYFAQLSFDEVMRLDPDTLTKIERVAKIDRIITDFLSSSFAKSMRNSAPVRPPIMRTNVILKEPNFKKALVLWQFIETYNQTAGFSTSDDVEDLKLEDSSVENLRRMVTLNTMLFESMYEEYETDMDMEDKQFGDFLRVGDMDFEKDEIDRDEYAQKLEQKKEDEDEEKNIEEVRPEEQPDAEHEIPPEQQPEEQKSEEADKEKDVERVVEVERFKEMAPKADQEEVDLEPDAVKFDQHLFEVRKLYKRPDDDKLKQEDIVKVRDAIDRCLTSYRRIKQEELDELERQARIRRRKEDIAKRALAFNKEREELSKSVDNMQATDVYFGMDPFSYQKAKLAREKLEQERLERLKLNQNEKLELEGDREGIAKEIDEMEAEKLAAQRAEQLEEQGLAPETEQSEISEDKEQPEVEEKVSEYNQPAREEDLPKKRGLRLSHGEEEVDPWAKQPEKPAKPVKDIEKVDENKVAVGGITFRDGTDAENPFGEGSEITANRAETRKDDAEEQSQDKPQTKQRPKRKPGKKKTATFNETSGDAGNAPAAGEQKSEDGAENKQVGEDGAATEQTPANKPKKPVKDIEKVDENKVAVGGITFRDGTDAENPFGGISDITSNRAETRKEEPEESAEEKPQAEPKPKRKPRKKKATPSKDTSVEENVAPEAGEQPIEDLASTDGTEGEQKPEETPKVEGENSEKSAENAAESAEYPSENSSENAQDASQDEERPAESEGKPAEEEEKVADSNAEAAPEQPTPQPEKPKRKRKAKNPGEISPTTANQKYSQPSGRKLNLTPVDERKVAVGGITFKDGSGIYDPLTQTSVGDLGNRAESQKDETEADSLPADNSAAPAEQSEKTSALGEQENREQPEQASEPKDSANTQDEIAAEHDTASDLQQTDVGEEQFASDNDSSSEESDPSSDVGELANDGDSEQPIEDGDSAKESDIETPIEDSGKSSDEDGGESSDEDSGDLTDQNSGDSTDDNK